MYVANTPALLVCILSEMLCTTLWKIRCSRSITNLRKVRLSSSRFSKDYWRALNVEYEETLKKRWRNIEENVANVNCVPIMHAKREKQTNKMWHDKDAFFRASQICLLPRILLFHLKDTVNWQRHKEMWKRLWCVRLRTKKCAVLYDAQYECGVVQRKDAQIKKFQYQRETTISREKPTSRERDQHQERETSTSRERKITSRNIDTDTEKENTNTKSEWKRKRWERKHKQWERWQNCKRHRDELQARQTQTPCETETNSKRETHKHQ